MCNACSRILLHEGTPPQKNPRHELTPCPSQSMPFKSVRPIKNPKYLASLSCPHLSHCVCVEGRELLLHSRPIHLFEFHKHPAREDGQEKYVHFTDAKPEAQGGELADEGALGFHPRSFCVIVLWSLSSPGWDPAG